MRKWKMVFCGLMCGILMLQMTGCKQSKDDKEIMTTEATVESNEEGQTEVSYRRSDSIVLEVKMDFKELQIEHFDDAVELYQDADLKHKIYCQYDWDKEEGTLSLLPPTYPVLNVSTVFASEELLREVEHSDYYLFDKGESQDWGNLGTMYLAKWRDLITGEVLEQPEVTEITVQGELDAPKNFRFEVSEYGNATLSWEPVEGASCYLVVEAVSLLDGDISGLYESCDIVAETTDTTWQSQTEDDYMNQEFVTFHFDEPDREYYMGVIAVCKTGTSMVSTIISKRDMAQRLPYAKAETEEEGEYAPTRFADNIDVLSRYQWIQLCDGTRAQRLIVYEVDKAQILNITDWEEAPKEMLQLPYTIDGTDFTGTFYVENFNIDSYQEDLEELEERQNILKSKMQGMLKDVEITVRPETDSVEEEDSDTESDLHSVSMDDTKKIDFDDALWKPVGSNDLSIYLAQCLLKGQERIVLTEEKNAIRQEEFLDAFYEAYYQNPLIPAVKEVSISESGDVVTITYEEDKIERTRKQEEVLKQVQYVAEHIVETNMSDVDKVLAINAYLCDHVEYDQKLEEDAGSYSDSLTPYGALVEKKGVCLAYAGAFQLLAKAMNLESIIVTGTMNGNEKHAWNKVKIEDNWVVVDVTSNDNDELENVLLNVTDDVAGYVLKEDTAYICDERLDDFMAENMEYEYYHLAGKYYEKDEIAKAFIRELSLGSKAVLRTDEALTNEEFQSIVKDVMNGMEQSQMQGYYRLGVIYLERKME